MKPWKVYGEGPTESAAGQFQDQKKPFTASDIRFTTKGDTLYAITLGIPSAPVMIKSLATAAGTSKINNVVLLGSNEAVSWSQKGSGLTIKNSVNYPSEHAAAYRITFAK